MKRIIQQATELLEKLHPMPQNALSIQVPVIESKLPALKDLLARINQDPSDNPIMPFSVFSNLHFMRLLLVDGPDHPDVFGTTLVVMGNVDGPLATFIEQWAQEHGSGLDQVFSHCQGYPAARKRTQSSRRSFLTEHQITSQAYYINTIGRTAEQIRMESELHEALQVFLNGLSADSFNSAQALRDDVIRFVRSNPELAWALASRARPGLLWRSIENLRFAALVALGLLILAWGWPVLAAWILTLRQREETDLEYTHRPSLERLIQLRSSEDIAAHNPFSAIGYVKPGLLRSLTVDALLAVAQVVLRHVFNNGNLAGVPLLGLDGVDTIHFARWTKVDNGRRLLFTSNYDGSLESYMVDFIDKVAWGLNLIFSNGVGYPTTRWLVHEGARKEQRFKDYLGNHQIENQVWYSPYPHLTAVNIANNAAIRDGLRGHMNERQAAAWLQRL